MRTSETYNYNKCIEAAAKLDLIGSMLEAMEETNEEILTEDEYEPIVEAQNTLHDISKIMRARAKLYITED